MINMILSFGCAVVMARVVYTFRVRLGRSAFLLRVLLYSILLPTTGEVRRNCLCWHCDTHDNILIFPMDGWMAQWMDGCLTLVFVPIASVDDGDRGNLGAGDSLLDESSVANRRSNGCGGHQNEERQVFAQQLPPWPQSITIAIIATAITTITNLPPTLRRIRTCPFIRSISTQHPCTFLRAAYKSEKRSLSPTVTHSKLDFNFLFSPMERTCSWVY